MADASGTSRRQGRGGRRGTGGGKPSIFVPYGDGTFVCSVCMEARVAAGVPLSQAAAGLETFPADKKHRQLRKIHLASSPNCGARQAKLLQQVGEKRARDEDDSEIHAAGATTADNRRPPSPPEPPPPPSPRQSPSPRASPYRAVRRSTRRIRSREEQDAVPPQRENQGLWVGIRFAASDGTAELEVVGLVPSVAAAAPDASGTNARVRHPDGR